MRRIAYLSRLAPVLAALLVVSGCGVVTAVKLKPQAKTMSHSRFVYLADRACARTERAFRHHPANSRRDPVAAVAFVRSFFVPRFEHLLFALRALDPPPSDAVAFRRMLAAFNAEDLVLHHFLDAADAFQVQRVKTLEKRLDRLGKRLDNRAAKLGLRTCAKG